MVVTATGATADLPVLLSKEDVKAFVMLHPYGHASALENGFAVYAGSVGDVREVLAVMGPEVNAWMVEELKIIAALEEE